MLKQLDIRVSGYPIALECWFGEVTMSTVWPGGSDELTWSAVDFPAKLAKGGADVRAYHAGACVWCGYLLEPDPSQDQMTAQGLWRLAEKFVALDGAGAATTVPNTAIDQAISRGLPWVRRSSISGSSVGSVDVSQGPVMLTDLLDGFTDASSTTRRWGVDTAGAVYVADDSTAVAYQVTVMKGGLGYALDDYASTLLARYFDSGTSTYKTVTVTSGPAVSAHGHQEQVVDLTTKAPMTAAQATQITTNLLNLAKATPQWTAPLNVSYGELLSAGGVPVSLETVKAGETVRVWSTDLSRNGSGYVDFMIGRTQLSDGVLTISPLQLAPRSLVDVLTAALNKKK